MRYMCAYQGFNRTKGQSLKKVDIGQDNQTIIRFLM